MPKDNYVSLIIDGQRVDFDPAGNIPAVDYLLEDDQDFEQKKADMANDIELPSTLLNQAVGNTLQNPAVRDYTPGRHYDKPLPAKLVANGFELLIGKLFFRGAMYKDGAVDKFKAKLYGGNGDWMIDLKETTLYDVLNPRLHAFDATSIEASWAFNGRSEAQDYVYAPVRYGKAFGDFIGSAQPNDQQAVISDMKPAVSVYWMLYRGFKKAGYRIVSKFMDTDYYRRGVLPWTWGGFDFLDDSRWEPLKFLAKSVVPVRFRGDYNEYMDWNVQDNVPGAYDNGGTPGNYQWIGASGPLPYMMVWKYDGSLGRTRAGLSIQVSDDYTVKNGSFCSYFIAWYVNGQLVKETMYNRQDVGFGLTSEKSGIDFQEDFFSADVNGGDYIGCRIRIRQQQGSGIEAKAKQTINVEQIKLDYLKLTSGSAIQFANYPKFKNYKFLDLLRGEVDLFDLMLGADPVRKEVYIEPRHDYRIFEGGAWKVMPGYFNRRQLDWTAKIDRSAEAELEIFADYDREFIFKFQNDSNDGGLKKVQDRNQAVIGQCKYVLPERFKTGKKDQENRFYAATMHVEHDLWKSITGISPQLIAIIPENISNTSSDAAENTFQPKRAFYKGNVSGVGGWHFNGTARPSLPYLFSVNYKPGGEADPILSYADQAIGAGVGKGLFSTFYLQRMAIVRHGRKWSPLKVRLNNRDVSNELHRESIIVDGIEYLLTGIQGYDPLGEDSTACTLWAFVPVEKIDVDATFPSPQSIRTAVTASSLDLKYWPHTLLTSDIKR